MNEDYMLTTFAEPITALADDPQLPPDEMKRRLQAPADEVRQAHNALAQTVKGITDATYPDTVTEYMLTDELAAKINSKANAADMTAALDAEAQAREALEAEMEQKLAQKCEIYCGSYNNSGATQTINLGFRPAAVIICSYSYLDHINGMSSYADIAIDGKSSAYTTIVDNGFTVQDFMNHSADGGSPYRYIAFKPVG